LNRNLILTPLLSKRKEKKKEEKGKKGREGGKERGEEVNGDQFTSSSTSPLFFEEREVQRGEGKEGKKKKREKRDEMKHLFYHCSGKEGRREGKKKEREEEKEKGEQGITLGRTNEKKEVGEGRGKIDGNNLLSASSLPEGGKRGKRRKKREE